MSAVASVVLYTTDRAEEAGWLQALTKECAHVALSVASRPQHAVSTPGPTPVPHLIVLDLDIADGAAFETLSWVRSQPVYAQVPVVAVISSPRSEEVDKAYRMGISSCLVKPSDSEEQDRIARGIRCYAGLLHRGTTTSLPN